MSCSSCQQNNHISNSTTEDSLCECACGCAEPTCPTPQPCTEITDARCIIYTQAAIKCGNDTVVTTNASASTALTQIVTYFCNRISESLIPDDIICNEEIIVNAGATVQDAIADIISYFCDKFNNTIDGSGLNNYLARWTPDGNTLGYGLIQDNGTRLGIGITPQVNFFLVITSIINENTFKSINLFAGSGSGTGVIGYAQGACLGNNYGVSGSASGALNSNVGGWFTASGNNPCSVRLSDGTQGVGKFLKSIDSIGSANWANITASDVSGVVAGSGTLNYLSKWTPNGTTLGNSLIQDNGTSIGINTNPASHPSYKLVVYGSGANSSGGLRVVNTTTAGLTNQAVYGAVIESEFTTTNLTITNTVGLLSSSTGGNTTNIGIQSNVNGSFAIGGSFNAGIISFINGNGNIANPTNYGIYSYVSAVSSLNPSIGHYVNVRQNTGGGGRYSVQLIDGTEGVGKFLKSTDAFGKANWATITTADISGYSSGTVVEAKAVYIDSVYGNNATAVKYDLSKPFLTWAAASAVAVAGDWIVFNTGTYVIGQVTPVSDVNVYCKPGVVIDGGFSITTSITWKLLGYAVFLTNTDTFRMTGTGQTYDIQLQFDRIAGLLAFGIVMTDTTSPLFKLVVDCNSITADLPFRLCAGANYDVVANFKHKLSGFGNDTVFFHNTVTASMTGTVIINCPIIENTSTSNTRHCLRITRAYSNFTCIINASVMRNTSPIFTDGGTFNIASVVVVENVDNLFINGDLEGGVIPCIVSYSPTAVYNTGNVTFTGNMYSDIEIVQHYAKALNGNGWHNIIIKKGYILSKGIGLSNAMFNRADNWIGAHGGTPGNIQLVDCIVHNKNFLTSVASSIMKDDLGAGVAKLNNFQMYNCLAFITGGIGYIVSTTQVAKETMMHNVRSNVPKMSSVSDVLSPTGLIVDPNLIIPTTKL